MKNICETAHDLLKEMQGECAVDFTCGNGFDTYFLASHFQNVYAFDIQESAIENTKKRCAEYENVHYILDTHANVDQYVESIDVGIFNCGYLPHGEKTIFTNAESVLLALEKALSLLKKKGRIILVLYPGFMEGKKEALEVENYVQKLSGKHFDVCKIQVLNRNHVPYILMIDKS